MAWHEGDVCHKLRRLRGWTVKQLAKEANLPTSVIHRLEDGRTKEPKRKTLALIAQAFRLSLREFSDQVPAGAVLSRGSEQETRRATG